MGVSRGKVSEGGPANPCCGKQGAVDPIQDPLSRQACDVVSPVAFGPSCPELPDRTASGAGRPAEGGRKLCLFSRPVFVAALAVACWLLKDRGAMLPQPRSIVEVFCAGLV